MMPVDIQAQYLNVEVDIVAQTIGNIGIDLKAATVEKINVDISAQTIGNLTIDIDAQSVGIYTQPEWAAKELIDKNFIATATNLTFGQLAYGSYTVPGTKALYLCGMSFSIYASASADADINQMGMAYLYNETDIIVLAALGGNGGGGIAFTKPIRVAANKEFRYYCASYANHEASVIITTWGYEL